MTTLLNDYTQIPSIRLALERVINQSNKSYEHHVGTAVNSLLQLYFPIGSWAITPEQIQTSKKKPDFVVERAENNTKLQPYLFVEIKKIEGQSFISAMRQAGDAVIECLDEMGQLKDDFATFVVIVRGIQIGFFEYYNYRELLDDENISNYYGLISLTQPIPQNRSASQPSTLASYITNLPKGLEKPKGVGSSIVYDTACIYDLQKHVGHVSWMFNYISGNIPRDHIG